MAVEGDLVYKDRDTIISELVASFQARLPDINLGADSIARIWIEVFATTVEGLFLANQLLHDDIFPQTADALALQRMGEYWGRPIKGGTVATGTLRFGGVGGTSLPAGMMVAAPSASDEALRFLTTGVALIPAPGIPTALTAADGGAGAIAAGTYEWAVSFQTAAGETAIGAVSNALVLSINHQANLTAIPLGGPGTTGRRIYRRLNGGAFALVTTIANNTTTTFTDNVVTGSLLGPPLVTSTAEQIDVAAQSEDTGAEYNVTAGTITDLVDAVTGVTSVTNPAVFAGGSDTEDIEVFRSELLDFIRAPKSGSAPDLEVWAEAIRGVENATVFTNDNLGTPQNGHATVRIVGPDGVTPDAGVQAAVLAELQSKDLINVTIHVGTFLQHTINVQVDVTTNANYSLSDVTPTVSAAISAYLNSVPIGGIVYVSGIVAAVFGLLGIATVSVVAPSTDFQLAPTEKASLGSLTVS